MKEKTSKPVPSSEVKLVESIVVGKTTDGKIHFQVMGCKLDDAIKYAALAQHYFFKKAFGETQEHQR